MVRDLNMKSRQLTVYPFDNFDERWNNHVQPAARRADVCSIHITTTTITTTYVSSEL